MLSDTYAKDKYPDVPCGQRCCNALDNAHGGFLAWLVDVVTIMPLMILAAGPAVIQVSDFVCVVSEMVLTV